MITVTFSKNRLMSIWSGMINRCTSEKNKAYKNYGGRGITVCDAWTKSFPSFAIWALTNGYEETLSIDRIRNNSSYNARNCKWSTDIEQQNNRRNNVRIRIGNKIRTISQWSVESGIPTSTISERYKRGIVGQTLLISSLSDLGEKHIYKSTSSESYRVRFRVGKNKSTYEKTFKTLEEAITDRDNYLSKGEVK